MKFLLTPVPSVLKESGGICRGGLYAAFDTEKNPVLETAFSLIGGEGTVPVRLEKPSGCAEYEAYEQHPEGYRLEIREAEAVISASSPAGYLYGAVTLSQLVRQFGDQVPCLLILDKPRWAHRGAQVCYAQMNVAYRREYLRRFLDKMCRLKINYAYLYLEWRYQFPSLPETHRSEYLSPEDVREMTAYAAARNITLVPQLNVMGHTGDLLAVERYVKLKEYDPETQDAKVGSGAALCPTNPATRELMEKALNDIMDAFDSPVIHVGGDEVEDIGVCPVCAERKKKLGKAGIYLDYFCWIRDVLQKRGRKMGIWGDMLARYAGLNPYYPPKEALVPTEKFLALREGTVIYNWSYNGPAKDSIDSFADNGFEVICSTSVHGCTVAVPWLGQMKNQYDYFKDGFRSNVLGGLVTDWIYGWGYHGEQMGALYASGEALMWQGVSDGFAAGCTKEELEQAAALQYYGAGPALVSYWHQAGDPDKGVLQFFPGVKNGSYLRKMAYLSDNPFAFYLKYSPYLRGREAEFHGEVEKLRAFWKDAQHDLLPEESEWFAVSGCSAVLFRWLEKKYEAADKFHAVYSRAAEVQYEDSEEFGRLLNEAAEVLESFSSITAEPRAFLTMEHEMVGTETGSLRRLEIYRQNLLRLAEFTRTLSDNRRALPSIQNLSQWMFERTPTGFWNPRSDEWYQEDSSFWKPETDQGTEWGSARW